MESCAPCSLNFIVVPGSTHAEVIVLHSKLFFVGCNFMAGFVKLAVLKHEWMSIIDDNTQKDTESRLGMSFLMEILFILESKRGA